MNQSVKIRAVVLTVSDRCFFQNAEDKSGAVLVERLTAAGAEIVEKIIVSDDFAPLVETLKKQSARTEVNLILTTGGTGFAPRDTTPEATRAVIERDAPGLAEAMRLETSKQVPTAILSRGVCGIRGHCLIVNLPGSPKGAGECFDVIRNVLPHAVNLLAGNTRH